MEHTYIISAVQMFMHHDAGTAFALVKNSEQIVNTNTPAAHCPCIVLLALPPPRDLFSHGHD